MHTSYILPTSGSFVNFYEIQEKHIFCIIRNVTHSRKQGDSLCNFVANNLTTKQNGNTGMKSLATFTFDHKVYQISQMNEFSNAFAFYCL